MQDLTPVRSAADAEVGADLSREPEIDLTMARHGSLALGVEAPETVSASLT